MDEKKKIVSDLINKIDGIYGDIAVCNLEAGYTALSNAIPVINSVFAEFIRYIPKLKELGVDIPADVLIQQLKNLLEAYEYKDSMLLADTLQYEIKDTLTLYLEILQELEKENIML